MKPHLLLALLTCGSAAIPYAPVASAQITQQHIRVGRHNDTTSVSDATIDNAMDLASTAFFTDSGSNDIYCQMELFRLYSQGAFANGDDDVDNQTEYQAVQGSGYGMNIVDTINWCGGAGTVDGCGWAGNYTPFLINRTGALHSAAGILIAHEFGHINGNSHEASDTLQIMTPVVSTSSVKVKNSTICDRWKADYGCWPGGWLCSVSSFFARPSEPLRAPELEPNIWTDRVAVTPAVPPAESAPEKVTSLSGIGIATLVDSLWADRVPVEASDYYNQSDVSYLKTVLADSTQSERHRKAATLIGLISDGNNDDAAALVGYIETSKEPDVAAAAMALGYLVKRHENALALDTLSKLFAQGDERSETAAVLGLSLTGSARAAETLGGSPARFANQAFLDEAAASNAKLQRGSLRAYYGLVD